MLIIILSNSPHTYAETGLLSEMFAKLDFL